jgi:hypothetical protein
MVLILCKIVVYAKAIIYSAVLADSCAAMSISYLFGIQFLSEAAIIILTVPKS